MEGLKWLLAAAFLAVILVVGITSVPSAPLTTEMERTTKADGLEITTLPPITVVYGEANRQIEVGKYRGWQCNIISEYFPTNKTGEIRLRPALVRFDTMVTSDEVIAELDARGLRPGDFDELLAFGIGYPSDRDRVDDVVALGPMTTHEGRCSAPALFLSDTNTPWLEVINDVDGKWWPCDCFLAFPKEVGG